MLSKDLEKLKKKNSLTQTLAPIPPSHPLPRDQNLVTRGQHPSQKNSIGHEARPLSPGEVGAADFAPQEDPINT